jgi:hypothetical protein
MLGSSKSVFELLLYEILKKLYKELRDWTPL